MNFCVGKRTYFLRNKKIKFNSVFRCVDSQNTPFCEGKNNIDNSLSAVSRSIAGGGGIDMEKVVGWRY